MRGQQGRRNSRSSLSATEQYRVLQAGEMAGNRISAACGQQSWPSLAVWFRSHPARLGVLQHPAKA